MRQVSQTNPSQLDARQNAAACLDPAVDVAAAPFDRMNGNPPFVDVGQERLDHPEARRFNDIVMFSSHHGRNACRQVHRPVEARFYLTA